MPTEPPPPVPMMPEPVPPAFAGPVAPAWTSLRCGRVREAAAALDALVRPDPVAQPSLTPDQLALALLLLVDVDLAAGEVGAATGRLGRLGDTDGQVARLAATLAGAETRAAYGDHLAARDLFLAAGELPGAEDVLVRPWWVGAIPALVRTGRRRDGAELARARVAQAEDDQDPFVLALGLRALATAESGTDPLALLRRAQRLAHLAGSRRLSAQLDTDIAALEILTPGRTDPEVVSLLRRAEAYAAAERLWPLHDRVAGLLAHVGERAHPVAEQAEEVLTPAERRVARLVGTGLTNRQAADELGISAKGVEWHLSRVYRKLGVVARDALAGLVPAGSDSDEADQGDEGAGQPNQRIDRP